MKKMLVDIVFEGSIAEEAGIEKGDSIISINNEQVIDIFDYRFLTVNENLLLEVEKSDGEIWEIEIEKDEYEDLGIEFKDFMAEEAKSCKNKCVFCFIDQLPKGMRETLYFKDDDSRLSFFMGNYVTLTNVNDNDINRIIKYKMSPINVSVHTTNPDLRVFMLKNKKSGDVLDKIKKLVNSGITVNCQIVLCRDINDKVELDKTISDLTSLYPGIASISVVPVGITKYREGLSHLEAYDQNSSLEVIKQIENWQRSLLKSKNSRIVYLADEFYIMAGVDMPDYEAYEDFPQIENGVGMIASFEKEFKEYLLDIDKNLKLNKIIKDRDKKSISIATGVSAYKYIKRFTNILEKKYENININTYEIVNNFFGEKVTVTGLITGTDLIHQLTGKELGEELFLCRCMLKADEEIFLDNVLLEEVEKKLDTKITLVEESGIDFIEKLLKIHKEGGDDRG